MIEILQSLIYDRLISYNIKTKDAKSLSENISKKIQSKLNFVGSSTGNSVNRFRISFEDIEVFGSFINTKSKILLTNSLEIGIACKLISNQNSIMVFDFAYSSFLKFSEIAKVLGNDFLEKTILSSKHNNCSYSLSNKNKSIEFAIDKKTGINRMVFYDDTRKIIETTTKYDYFFEQNNIYIPMIKTFLQ